MKLWLLRPIDDEEGPWKPWYDKTFGFVVRAKSEEGARAMASEEGGYEGREVWLDESLTTCVRLTNKGEPGVIIEDHYAA